MNWNVLPPGPGKCPTCAVAHKDNDPHDPTSLYYQVLFANANKRSPTWADAMMHCDQEAQKQWTQFLTEMGIDVNSTNVRGGIKTQQDLNERLEKAKDNH